MTTSNASSVGGIISGFCVVAVYMVFFWRMFKRNPGNRMVECGALTLFVFFMMIPFTRIPGFTDQIPDWIFLLYILLIVLLCFTTLFFFAQRLWRGSDRDAGPRDGAKS
jgi:heme A synthase